MTTFIVIHHYALEINGFLAHTMSRAERILLYLFGLGWFIGGLIYAYAGVIAPTPFLIQALQTPEHLQQFFTQAAPGWLPSVLAFSIFIVADFAQIFVGTTFYRLFEITDWRGQALRLCFLLAGLSGMLSDIIMLSSWTIIHVFQPGWPSSYLSSLWSILLLNQYTALWLSALASVLAGVGLLLIYLLSHKSSILSPALRLFTAFIVLLSGFFVAAVIGGAYTGNLLPMGITFLMTAIIAVPIWCLWAGSQSR